MHKHEQIYQNNHSLVKNTNWPEANLFAIYKCCEQIQIWFRTGPESPVPERPVSTNLGLLCSTFFYLLPMHCLEQHFA